MNECQLVNAILDLYELKIRAAELRKDWVSCGVIGNEMHDFQKTLLDKYYNSTGKEELHEDEP